MENIQQLYNDYSRSTTDIISLIDTTRKASQPNTAIDEYISSVYFDDTEYISGEENEDDDDKEEKEDKEDKEDEQDEQEDEESEDNNPDGNVADTFSDDDDVVVSDNDDGNVIVDNNIIEDNNATDGSFNL